MAGVPPQFGEPPPSMLTGLMTAGSGEVGWIVCGEGPAILKTMLSAPAEALAAFMASRRLQCAAVHAPRSRWSMVLTVNVVAASAGLAPPASIRDRPMLTATAVISRLRTTRALLIEVSPMVPHPFPQRRAVPSL